MKKICFILFVSLMSFSLYAEKVTSANLHRWADQALKSYQPGDAIVKLRNAGPIAVKILLTYPRSPKRDKIIDRVARQKYASFSKMYWYTDLEKAKKQAKRFRKPILSLHLLGQFDEDLCCANSRFMRTVLYANTQISQYLRENFILHWHSIRPVPKVTIDFGDGRKINRTITGNSIHYLLNADGKIIDALPGLYGPQAFREVLGKAYNVWHQTVTHTTTNRALRTYHQQSIQNLEISFAKEASLVGIELTPNQAIEETSEIPAAFSAEEAGLLTASKIVIEKPLMDSRKIETLNVENSNEYQRLAVGRQNLPSPLKSMSPDLLRQICYQIAELKTAENLLDNGSKALICYQNGFSSLRDPRLQIMVRRFQKTLAMDTVSNEYQFHYQIHERLLNNLEVKLEDFNEQIYAELFKTPSSDPWLGLKMDNTYTALLGNGLDQ